MIDNKHSMCVERNKNKIILLMKIVNLTNFKFINIIITNFYEVLIGP